MAVEVVLHQLQHQPHNVYAVKNVVVLCEGYGASEPALHIVDADVILTPAFVDPVSASSLIEHLVCEP